MTLVMFLLTVGAVVTGGVVSLKIDHGGPVVIGVAIAFVATMIGIS